MTINSTPLQTTAQIRASIIARDCAEREDKNEVVRHQVYGEKPPKVVFLYADNSSKMFDGRKWYNI